MPKAAGIIGEWALFVPLFITARAARSRKCRSGTQNLTQRAQPMPYYIHVVDKMARGHSLNHYEFVKICSYSIAIAINLINLTFCDIDNIVACEFRMDVVQCNI